MDLDRWWGGLATIGCSLGLQHGHLVVGVVGLAGAVAVAGACFFMLMDALSG